MALSVIGAGLPRTGTTSLKLALEQLGLGPCHHMTEVFAHPESWPAWDKVGRQEPVDWDEVFKGYVSAVDAPACWFYLDLAARYPDAKVILTVRDPDAWHASVQSTVNSPEARQAFAGSKVGPVISRLRALSGRTLGMDWLSWTTREQAMGLFQDHQHRVRERIPADRLLVYDVAQGWDPLCAFLGRPAPATPFPRTNNAREFWSSMTPLSAE